MSLDTSKVFLKDSFFNAMNSKIVSAFNEMDALEKGAVANVDEKRMVGHYWLRNFSLAPNQNISLLLHDNWLKIKTFAEKIIQRELVGSTGSFKNVLCIGIGGSALGPQFVSNAIGRGYRGLKIFFIDNTDPDGMQRVLKRISKQLGQTLVIVTSKSGGTPEPRNALIETKAMFERKKVSFCSQAVAITCEGSALDKQAKNENWLSRFYMWDWVGGRTSLFSNVGLLPSALQNINIGALVQGATEMDILTRNTEVLSNPAMMLALSWYYCAKAGKKNMVVLPYKDDLCLLPKYLQQLIMESLGKKLSKNGSIVHEGLTVYGNKGSTDQHAYVQQLRDGLDDSFVTFIEVLRPKHSSAVTVEEELTSADFLEGFMLGTRQALAEVNRPSITITMKHLNEQSIGALIALFERAVGYYASFVDINAYNQPGVEAGKKAASKFLLIKKQVLSFFVENIGETFSISEVANGIGMKNNQEDVFKILEYLAANRKIFRNKILPLTKSTYTLKKK